ncbi:MAG: carotenoid oxygenase family protein [Pirellula sp.]
MASKTTQTVVPDFGMRHAFFREIEENEWYRIHEGEHSIPAYLRGTLYFNGPAKFQFGHGLRYRNWLDGDGMVCALHFAENGLYCANRFVRGRKFVREKNGDPIYRSFGTAFPGDRLKRGIGTESPYNVSVFPYRGKLLAFGEQSLPMELDPVTLETVTPEHTFDFEGALNDAAPFSAHPKIDDRTGELLNFGVFFSPLRPVLVYYRFDQNGALACRTQVPLDMPCSLHDFASSEHFVIFYLSPYVLDSTGLTKRGLSTLDSLSWQPERGGQILILNRSSGDEVARIPIAGKYCLHTINAFERDSTLVLDVIELERPMYDQYLLPNLFEDAPGGQPTRYEIDLDRFTILEKKEIPYRCAPDFPTIDSRLQSSAYNQMWMLGISKTGSQGAKFFDQLVHANWLTPNELDIWSCPAGYYLGSEPVFIPSPDTVDDGIVICHLLDGMTLTSHFAFFPSNHISKGPSGLITLANSIHLGFHSSFQPSAE